MMNSTLRVVFLFFCIGLGAGCVPLPEDGSSPERGGITRASFSPLDPGAKTAACLHFEVRAYSSASAEAVCSLAERSYERIMRDTSLYSFMQREPYPIVIYGSHEEYVRKTGMPQWSGGAAAGNSLFTYESPATAGVLAHEMTHLIFNEYMGRQTYSLRWINEGLAVFEEQQASGRLPAALPPGRAPLSFDRMADTAPLSESSFDASAWYAQASSVVRFMIERGGQIGFGQFLAALRDGRPVTEAVRAGFPGTWNSLAEVESAWRGTVQ
ncbi:MAG: hypothetical protein WCU88_10020 [Elusimicrobiota bacterium]